MIEGPGADGDAGPGAGAVEPAALPHRVLIGGGPGRRPGADPQLRLGPPPVRRGRGQDGIHVRGSVMPSPVIGAVPAARVPAARPGRSPAGCRAPSTAPVPTPASTPVSGPSPATRLPRASLSPGTGTPAASGQFLDGVLRAAAGRPGAGGHVQVGRHVERGGARRAFQHAPGRVHGLAHAAGCSMDLGPAVLAPVEPGVAVGGLVQGQLVRDDQRGVGLAADDQVPELGVVPLDRALAVARGDGLVEHLPVVQPVAAFPGALGGLSAVAADISGGAH
jgi:hypothetical protein